MASTRRTRYPISCEPCRTRKIRCTRDAPPCATCIRRKVHLSQCKYTKPSADEDATNLLSSSPQSAVSTGASSSSHSMVSNSDLVSRVAKLEQLLQAPSSTTSARTSQSLDMGTSSYTDEHEHRQAGDSFAQHASKGTQGHGRLHTSTSGHMRFIPSYSTWSPGLGSTSYETDDHCALLDSSNGPFPFRKPQHDTFECLASLPPLSLCAKLKDVYFTSFGPLFHILHDPTFERQYALFKDSPESMPLAWLALLYAILGTAVISLDSNSEIVQELSRRPFVISKIEDLSERYRTASMRCLEADNFLWRHNVSTVQALVILIYGINHSHGQSWSLLGLAHHIALSIGCHIDPSEFQLNLIECEERRRCWAGLMMLYTIQNSVMGDLGPLHNPSNYSISLPADVNDSDLTPNRTDLPPQTGLATQMSYLILKFRLYELCASICSRVLRVCDPAPATIRTLDEAILREQQHWERAYSSHLGLENLPVYQKVHFNILSGYSHQLLLLLHRPVLLQYVNDSDQHRQSRARCMQSAKSILAIHALFHDSPDFSPFSWYHRGLGSFHAFHAIVTLLLIYFLEPRELSSYEVSEVIQPSLNRFESMTDRSLICRRASPVIRHLLNNLGLWSNTIGQTVQSGITHSHSLSSGMNTQLHSQVSPPVSWTGLQESHFTTSEDLAARPNLLLEQLEPWEWLNPSAIPWNQWEAAITNITV